MKNELKNLGIEEIIPAEDQLTGQLQLIRGGGLFGLGTKKKCKTGCAKGVIKKAEVECDKE